MPLQRNNSFLTVYVPLRLTFGFVPLIAGIDKFFNVLVDWTLYLPPLATSILPLSPSTIMMIVGVIEITAGLAVLTVLTRLGAYVVMVWLLGVAVAVAGSGFIDIAVRDVVMAIAAYTLGQIAGLRGDAWIPTASSSRERRVSCAR